MQAKYFISYKIKQIQAKKSLLKKIERYKIKLKIIRGKNMAAPRIFISSTYYDLLHVRDDIRNFIIELGYEPVMHDRGTIPYTQSKSLETSCYEELTKCDIIICIIGGKFGTESEAGNYSITMQELKNALKARKKIYIYIVNDVYIENKTYLVNLGGDFKSSYTDDTRIHEFISEIKNEIRDYPIVPFTHITDIIDDLRTQFAGMFQYLLSQEASVTEAKTYYDLQQTSNNIKEEIENFKNEKNELLDYFGSLSITYNLILNKIRKDLKLESVGFIATTKKALEELFIYLQYEKEEEGNKLIFRKSEDGVIKQFTISKEIYDNRDKLKDIRIKEKIEEYVIYEEADIFDFGIEEAELPFN